MQHVRIPEERVNVLIGTKGAVKRSIEAKTKCKLSFTDNEVAIEGDALDEWVAKDIVHAIGRGFNPEKALMLAQEDHVFEFVELKEYASTSKSLERIKGRLIGEDGRTRRYLERNTGALVSVYGKTVSFIGRFDEVALAKEAAEMLASGRRHVTVYKFLDKQRGVIR